MDCLTEKIWLKANNNSSRLLQGTIEFKERTSNEYEPIQKNKTSLLPEPAKCPKNGQMVYYAVKVCEKHHRSKSEQGVGL